MDLRYKKIEAESDGILKFAGKSVYKAYDIKKDRIVAIKAVRVKDNEIDEQTIREMALVQELDHPNIVRSLEPVSLHDNTLYIVMEFLTMNLDQHTYFYAEKYPRHAKRFMQHLMEALQYAHSHEIMHRDIKSRNLLIDTNLDVLKLGGFSLARPWVPLDGAESPKAVTLIYRAPELLLAADMYKYSYAVDMWSAGCIFGEMVKNNGAIFGGSSEIEVLKDIFRTLGTPQESSWIGVTPLLKRYYLDEPYIPGKDLSAEFPLLGENGLDLLRGLLHYNPAERLTAHEALAHQFFRDEHPFRTVPDAKY